MILIMYRTGTYRPVKKNAGYNQWLFSKHKQLSTVRTYYPTTQSWNVSKCMIRYGTVQCTIYNVQCTRLYQEWYFFLNLFLIPTDGFNLVSSTVTTYVYIFSFKYYFLLRTNICAHECNFVWTIQLTYVRTYERTYFE